MDYRKFAVLALAAAVVITYAAHRPAPVSADTASPNAGLKSAGVLADRKSVV